MARHLEGPRRAFGEAMRRLAEEEHAGGRSRGRTRRRRWGVAAPTNHRECHDHPQLSQAERLLSDFAAFWEAETSPAERHRLLTTLFEQVLQDDGTIVAVKPRGAFVPYFQTASQTTKKRSGSSGVQSGSDGTRTLVRHRIEIRSRIP
jgi:hypothetical protein